jgi:hypothetical protein
LSSSGEAGILSSFIDVPWQALFFRSAKHAQMMMGYWNCWSVIVLSKETLVHTTHWPLKFFLAARPIFKLLKRKEINLFII